MAFQFDPNMSFVRPQDALGLVGAGLPSDFKSGIMNMAQGSIGGVMNQGFGQLGMNTDMLQAAQMAPNQYPGSAQAMVDKMAAADADKANMDAMGMMAKGVQGLFKPQAMPSGNTAQIIRDQNQFRFAGNPQQQMAQALRNR
jgi:hypothetical protein